MRALGVDPGLRITGYGCVEDRTSGVGIVEAGVIRLVRGGEEARSVSARLAELDRDFRELLERVRPDVVGVEAVFSHVAHPATAIIMGHARGVLLLAVERAGLPLVELRPTQVKKAMSGWGAAGKSQMQRAVQARFGLERPPSPPDVADALAIAVCVLERSGDFNTETERHGVRNVLRRGA